MALERMHDEMIHQLRQKAATQTQVADYETRWNHAMSHSGEPLPCPSCFLNGQIRRLKSVSEEAGVGVVRCEQCRDTFEYEAPEAS